MAYHSSQSEIHFHRTSIHMRYNLFAIITPPRFIHHASYFHYLYDFYPARLRRTADAERRAVGRYFDSSHTPTAADFSAVSNTHADVYASTNRYTDAVRATYAI